VLTGRLLLLDFNSSKLFDIWGKSLDMKTSIWGY